MGWEAIFPYGEATSLKEALDPRFDDYFDDLPKVHYDSCRQGFVLENGKFHPSITGHLLMRCRRVPAVDYGTALFRSTGWCNSTVKRHTRPKPCQEEGHRQSTLRVPRSCLGLNLKEGEK